MTMVAVVAYCCGVSYRLRGVVDKNALWGRVV